LVPVAAFAAGLLPAQDPSSLPGMRLWLRADAGVKTAAAALTQWNDPSPARNPVTQTTAALRACSDP
jgi:hypothetical protein